MLKTQWFDENATQAKNVIFQQYLDIMQARMGGKHLKDMKRMRKEKYVSSL